MNADKLMIANNLVSLSLWSSPFRHSMPWWPWKGFGFRRSLLKRCPAVLTDASVFIRGYLRSSALPAMQAASTPRSVRVDVAV